MFVGFGFIFYPSVNYTESYPPACAEHAIFVNLG